jgi:hypothetical protein
VPAEHGAQKELEVAPAEEKSEEEERMKAASERWR